jgi:hypothetical protein
VIAIPPAHAETQRADGLPAAMVEEAPKAVPALKDRPKEPWCVTVWPSPGFDLLPALDNHWDDIVATGDPATAVRRRFDQLTETPALDRDRATGRTLARILRNSLWDIEDGNTALDPAQATIAQALAPRHRESRVQT